MKDSKTMVETCAGSVDRSEAFGSHILVKNNNFNIYTYVQLHYSLLFVKYFLLRNKLCGIKLDYLINTTERLNSYVL